MLILMLDFLLLLLEVCGIYSNDLCVFVFVLLVRGMVCAILQGGVCVCVCINHEVYVSSIVTFPITPLLLAYKACDMDETLNKSKLRL